MALGGNVQAIPHDAVIRPVTAKAAKPAHVSTPHATTATTTANTPSWLNTAALTPAQIQAETNTEVNNEINPQIQGVQSQQATYDAQQKAYQAAMTGFYSALAPYMAGIQGHVSDAYNSAASTMGDVAKGYSGTLGANATADNTAANAALARAGQAPLAAPGAGLTTAFDATNGGLQGSSLAAEGAAKASDAANKPAIWAAQGRDSLTEAINKAVAGDQTYVDQVNKIYATVPALRDTITKGIQDQQIKIQTLQNTEQKTSFDENAKTTSLGQGQQRINLQATVDAFNQKYKINSLNLRGQALQLQAQKFAQSTLSSDRNYAIALQRLGISKAASQRAALAAQYKYANGGFTSSQVNKFKATLQQGIDGITVITDPSTGAKTYVAQDANPKDKTGWTKVGKVYQRPVTYNDYVATAVSHGVPLDMAITRANAFFPSYDRPDPKSLANLTGLTPSTAAMSTGQNLGVGQAKSGGFVPRGTAFQMKRTDQGRDIQTAPNSPIVAPGAGYVVRIGSDPGGGGTHFGPAYPIVHFTSGPYAGQDVYIGHTTAKVKAGAKFKAGDVLSITGSGGPESGGAPPGWAEIGFAPGGTPGKFGQPSPF